MKKDLFSALALLIVSSGIIGVISFVVGASEKAFELEAIPQNNAQVAGIQKYLRPPQSQGLPPPQTSARSSLVKDLLTDTTLYQKDVNLRLPIASTTKIMTALVASEYFNSSSVLTVKDGARIGGARVGLFSGEKLSFQSLLYGMLLSSGNDAAYTLAENYPGGVTAFVEVMNQKAKTLSLENTHFDNPAGFDSPLHYSTAQDLAKITQEALKKPKLTKIFATKNTLVTSLDKKYHHQLNNLNKLLTEVWGVLGVKTGYTSAAKENLVGLVERRGIKILTIVLGSDDRFGDSTALIEWTFQNYLWP